MDLIHSTHGNFKDIYSILKDGKLLSSSITGNAKFHGTCSDYVFFSLNNPEKGIINKFRWSAMFHFKSDILPLLK